ncbi:hypothetical protein [Micrococcus lylae]|uniref:Uncharacterized protein n=2 Tax=Micrococcus lylae TaxID=1273 RepID=A0ABY2K1Q7_9MICC|nr:hypothetical protein [Micrococcus lylae]TFI01106.1 hypothetical protein E4A49_01170 [Micrococcus lylae]
MSAPTPPAGPHTDPTQKPGQDPASSRSAEPGGQGGGPGNGGPGERGGPAGGGPGGPAGGGWPGRNRSGKNGSGKPANEAEELKLRKNVGRLLLWQCGLLLCTILAMDLLLPWKLLAAPFAVGAVAVGFVAWMRAGKLTKPGFLRVMLGAGLALGTFVAVASLTPLLFWEAASAYDECLRQALTLKSEAVCQAEFTKTMGGIGGLGG